MSENSAANNATTGKDSVVHAPTVRKVRCGDGNIHVLDYQGAEPAFVLMHGFPDNMHIYDYLVPYLLEGGRRVVTFDFLGYGASDKPNGATYNFRQQLDNLKAVLDDLKISTAVPVAHDSSGAAAINFALDYPERVNSLVILNAAYAQAATVKWPELIELFSTPSLRSLTQALIQSPTHFSWVVNFQREQFKGRLAEKYRARYDSFLGSVIDSNFRQTPSCGPAFVQMTGDFFSELERNTIQLSRLKSLDTPVKIVWGVQDPYLNVGVAEDFHARFKNSTLHLVEAGHWLQIDEPELVAKLMLS